ncbi:MAG: molybdopterin-dependent oxidoreductase [Desulfuromonadaceae bacterium]|nr:molybdopterin-dependent oxidoreductase [Desulfuromonadaceae bacterium]
MSKSDAEIKYSTCYFCTSRGCAMKVHVEGDRIRNVTYDTKAPITPGGFCIRPGLARDYQEHPFRLSFPLKRVGERGEDKWQQLSWPEALDEIAGKLDQLRRNYGPETLATSSGTGRGGWDFAKTRFMNLFGSPNRMGAVTVCYGPRSMVSFTTFGAAVMPRRKAGQTQLTVLWGRNPHEGGPSTWHGFQEAAREGIRTMVVDPRCTEAARSADLWVQIKPGTDAALALGMMNILIEEGLYDQSFVEAHTAGFPRLVERVRDYPPDRVARITGLSEYRLREISRFFAAHQPATFTIGVASEHSPPNSIQAVRAINILFTIAGSIDVEGGGLLAGPVPGFIPDAAMEANEALSPEQRKKQLGSDRFRFLSYPGWELVVEQLSRKWGERHPAAAYLNCMAHAPSLFRAMLTGKPYPVKGLIVSASNPLLSYANTKLVYRALKALDLLVTLDITWTPTAQLSDYVLPAACWLERPDMGNFSSVGAYPVVQIGEAALPAQIPGRYDRFDDYRFWRELGMRLGQEESWPWPTFEKVWEYRLREIMDRRGVDSLSGFIRTRRWETASPEPGRCGEGTLATPSGKIEIYSTILEKLGYDPLPAYQEPAAPDDTWRSYDLLNISGPRTRPYHHSEFRHVDSFRRRHPQPIVEIPVDTALRHGIVDGDWVWIETPLGRAKQRARLTTSFAPGLIATEHAWWYPEEPGAEPSLYGVWKSNINVTTDDDPDKCDPLSGAWPFKGPYLRCRIRKASAGDND